MCGGSKAWRRLSLQGVGVRGTPVGVIAPVEAEILGRSEWLLLMTRWAWLWCHRISARVAAVICPCVVGIEYKSHALTGSFSLDAAPVNGSLLFYTHVCCLAVCCAAGFSSWVLIFFVGDCFPGELVWLV